MNKEKQIESWINGSLKGQDLEDFKSSETYNSLKKIDHTALLFKAPDFDEEASRASINSAKKAVNHTPSKSLYYKISGVAAILIAGLFIAFQFFGSSTVSYGTTLNEEQILTLPDKSTVYLNSNSKLSYSDSNFKDNRILYLEGEAFFEVQEGTKFIVNTPVSQVEVLGTSFNIKSRNNFSEVDCYTGKVKVTDFQENEAILTPFQRFSNYNGKFEVSKFSNQDPGWIGLRKSSFNNTPLYVVINELAIQYNVNINTDSIDTNTNFSGSFSHDNLENALESVTLPFQIDFVIKENQVTLQKE